MKMERVLWIILGIMVLMVLMKLQVYPFVRCATTLCFAGFSFLKLW